MHRCVKGRDAVRLPRGQGATAIDGTSRSAPLMRGFSSVAVLRRVAFWSDARALRRHVGFDLLPRGCVARSVRWKQRFENGVLVGENQPLGRRECPQCVFVQGDLHVSTRQCTCPRRAGVTNVIALRMRAVLRHACTRVITDLARGLRSRGLVTRCEARYAIPGQQPIYIRDECDGSPGRAGRGCARG